MYYFMLSVLQKSGHGMAQLVSLLWVPQNVGITRAVILSGGFGEVAASKLPLVFSRILFLVVVGLKSPFPCWLSAGGYRWLLETFLWSLHLAPTSQNQQ